MTNCYNFEMDIFNFIKIMTKVAQKVI